ncbi:MAG: flagellar basal body-associated FliL family protein [Lachnospiraceae bacterium]|nr:flagellar basal body-associated FliL family protein [Lachnospiraceae bacterium]
MKKNMLAVLILILTIVNITLTAVMLFTVLPNAQQTDNLIKKIVQIIDLELESPLPENINQSYSIEDVEKFILDEMQTNLKTSENGKTHFAQVNASLTINKTHEDYKKLNPMVETMKNDIRSIIMTEISKYTFEQLNEPDQKQAIKEKVLSEIQELFNSKFIVDMTIDYLFQ